MNFIVLQNQEPVLKLQQTLNQYPIIKAQTPDEFQAFENSENSTVVFDDKLPSKRESKFDLFYTRGRHNNIGKNYKSLFSFPEKNSN